MFKCITRDRVNADGELLPPVRSKGIKWAIIAAIAVVAATVFALAVVAGITMAALTFASGVGAAFGVMHLASAVVSIGICVQMCMIAYECILNAKHHLAKPKELSAKVEELSLSEA